jgi:hypothetical protein
MAPPASDETGRVQPLKQEGRGSPAIAIGARRLVRADLL